MWSSADILGLFSINVVRKSGRFWARRFMFSVRYIMDTAATWTPMLNDLRGDEEIRRNYQFWFYIYSYPSGYPYPYSALILRQELDAIQKKFPMRKPMVVIGHSMGGCISRLLITDTGDQLWLKIFDKPPAQTQLSPAA
jgi:triacylglycerol esterase/lipase EstA (alpha/beta hydrolase family)